MVIEMLFSEKVKISNEVSELIKKHGRERSSLLPILKEYHKNHNTIPEFAKQEITRLLNINPYELNEVISFNKFLRNKPEAKNIVMFCNARSCSEVVKNEITDAVKKEFKVKFGEPTKDGKFLFKFTGCLGMCHLGPVMTINDRVYSEITKEKALRILKSL